MRGYFHPSSRGRIEIVRYSTGWNVIFKGEELGTYSSPDHAADDVGGGHTYSPSDGTDFELLSISRDLADATWQIG